MFTIQDKLDEYYDYATTLKGFQIIPRIFGKIMPKILVLDIIQTLVLTYLCNNKCIMKNEQNNNEPTRLDFIRSLIADCRYDDAMEMLQIATEDEPDNIDYNYELARIFMEMGNYSSAVSNLELVLEKTQSSLLYFYAW